MRADDTNVAIRELTRVSGIGPANAKKLVDQKITSIARKGSAFSPFIYSTHWLIISVELRKHTDKLNHHQKIGLQYLEEFEQRIPREEMDKLETVVTEAAKELDQKYIVTVCGSYRRGAESSGDIDILLTHPSFSSESKNNRVNQISKMFILVYYHAVRVEFSATYWTA